MEGEIYPKVEFNPPPYNKARESILNLAKLRIYINIHSTFSVLWHPYFTRK